MVQVSYKHCIADTSSRSSRTKKAYVVCCHAGVAPELSRLGFEVFLLPSPEHRQVWHSAARFPDNGALQPGALGGLDDDAIDGLLTEVRQIIGSAKFGVALKVRSSSCNTLTLLYDSLQCHGPRVALRALGAYQ